MLLSAHTFRLSRYLHFVRSSNPAASASSQDLRTSESFELRTANIVQSTAATLFFGPAISVCFKIQAFHRHHSLSAPFSVAHHRVTLVAFCTAITFRSLYRNRTKSFEAIQTNQILAHPPACALVGWLINVRSLNFSPQFCFQAFQRTSQVELGRNAHLANRHFGKTMNRAGLFILDSV